MDINEIMKMAQGFQGKIKETQEQLTKEITEAESGAGMVKCTMNGKFELVSLKIDPKLISDGDTALIEDLTRAAINSAVHQVAEKSAKSLGGIGGDMGLDISQFMPK